MMGKIAFQDCTNLSRIDDDGSSKMISSLSTTTKTGNEIDDNIDLNFAINAKLPRSLRSVGKMAFNGCPKLVDIIDTNSICFQLDLNRGGYEKFLRCRKNHHDKDHDDDNQHRVSYYSSLWPLILHRIMNKMELPKNPIRQWEYNLSFYTDTDSIRRASVVYVMMIHGVAMHY